ncbi:MAG: hypothetical protein NTW14_13905 [bacterium]|nr:hypothetical protein [bacterium]
MCFEQWIAIITLVVQALIAGVAVWGALRLTDWWRRPELEIQFDQFNGNDIFIEEVTGCYYKVKFMGRVFNKGKSGARDVEVVLTNIESRRRDDENAIFTRVQNFQPVNLKWACTSHASVALSDSPVYHPLISPKLNKYFHLASFSQDSLTFIDIDRFKTSSHVVDPLFSPFSVYKLEISVAASNVSETKTFIFIWDFKEIYDIERHKRTSKYPRDFTDYFEINLL